MEGIIVYRIDRVRKTKVAVGTVIERRKKERGRNLIGLLQLARETFVCSPQESYQIDAGGMVIEF